MKKKLKLVLALLIIAATFGTFIYYAVTHPQVTEKLRTIGPGTLIPLLLAFGLAFVALALILRISLAMYGKRLEPTETLLLNAYSSILNFFGPGQSGPAVRGVYLKKKHNFSVKSYIFTTLMYYGFYAVISAFLLCIGSRPWWQTTLLVGSAAVGSMIIIKWYAGKSKLGEQPGINPKTLGLLFAATVLQLFAQTIIYYIELRSVSPTISISQVITYTGAANFALFASITPGAIGIREAFLVFSQNLHHISSTVIVAANIIDRAVYLLFLGLLFLVVIIFHAKERFTVKP